MRPLTVERAAYPDGLTRPRVKLVVEREVLLIPHDSALLITPNVLNDNPLARPAAIGMTCLMTRSVRKAVMKIWIE